ncbi:beta-glucanase (GH16 family) [Variovorax sp. SG517]|uniref:family 16 glycosylhydrolase n=1 Tax=Variovorax sp. SG517 TaxID=2587117 RepID=UPI00159D221E|nr:family 16 glycosylhydrolase [Variovorax sp. SG517]NVM87842.1 beta-glucanase (GH16 family) [Variovorax sp. SG517]
MKSVCSIKESEVTKNQRRQFLQKSASAATAFWGGLALVGCGGGGSDGSGGFNGASLLPASGNGNGAGAGETPVPGSAEAPESGNSLPVSVNNSTAENLPQPVGQGVKNDIPSPSETSPIVQSFVPTAEAPGGSIVITGAKFDSTAIVSFGGVRATQISVDSATQISVTVPALAVTGPVTVETAGGTGRSVAPFAVLSAPAPAAGYRLAWHDEFDGTSLNTSNWRAHTATRYDAVRTADAVDVSNSILTITTYTDPSTGKHHTAFLDTNISSGCKFTFGYIEARMRFVNRSGQWSAFWLQSNRHRAATPPNPAAGVEIDIIEHRAFDDTQSDARNHHSSAVHWNGYGADRLFLESGVRSLPAGESFSDWHTAGLLWTPGKYQFFLDGVQFWEATDGISQSDEFIRLTTEVKDKGRAGEIPPGGYGPRGADTNAVTQVDWVRVWQLPPAP